MGLSIDEKANQFYEKRKKKKKEKKNGKKEKIRYVHHVVRLPAPPGNNIHLMSDPEGNS